LNDDGTWEPIESGNEQNRKAKEFHSFSSDEFDSEGKLIGANNIGILVDQNGDGLIELDPSLSNDILQSLTIDYSASEIQAVDVEKFGRIREKVAIFLLQDDDLDVQNVYSWNVEKFFE